jgi:dephospho-CoA kinase
MFILGLTGGIGSGKSTAAERFASHSITIIDSDLIARKVVAKGQSALATIADHFGSSALTMDGELNRQWLRQRIFANSTDKCWLEGLLHPLIRIETQKQIAAVKSIYGVLCIPLLLESNQQDLVDRIVVIDTHEDKQIHRSCQRDNMTKADVKVIMASQLSSRRRLQQADIVISNNGSIEDLHAAVDNCHQQLIEELTVK